MKLAFLFLFLLTAPFYSFSQKLNKTEYDKAVDYITCLCINETFDPNDKIDCKQSQLEKEQIPVAKGITISLYDELQKLKNESPNDPVQFLSERIFSDSKKYNKIYTFAIKDKNRLIVLKNGIKNYFSEQNASTVDTIPALDSTSIEPAVEANTHTSNENQYESKPNNEMNQNQDTFFDFNFWTILFGVMTIIIFILLYLIYEEVAEQKKRLERKIGRSISTTSTPISDTSVIEQEIKNLKIKLRELEEQFKAISRPLVSNTIPLSREMELKVPEKLSNELFYMAAPNEDGSFDVSGKTSKDSALYEFIVDPSNPSKAKFTFAAKDSNVIRSIVDYSQSYINPVCEPQNALNQNAKQITTLQSGIAEKRNDRWVVIKKAQIKYE